MKSLVLFVAALLLVVGLSEVAGASAGEARCGRRLVSGLFSRPRLPLGYSLVATVPRGACRLNVSEILPTDNYIALKLMNGSYIMNGEFAVSAPGSYEAAGARFIYSRNANVDNVFARGPIQHPIDIMILYTEPNPSIKYEYLTDASPEETTNDIPGSKQAPQQDAPHPRHHRHHNPASYKKALENKEMVESNVIGDRKFMWKILAFTTCSRTCGGGLQIGKFRCVEAVGGEDREVSAAHCSGAPPPSRRRRCGVTPCAPRWRAAPWGPCPVCGPAHRTRIVGCVQDHTKGLTKISDQNCPLPMPPNSEPCDIPNCDGTASTTEAPRVDQRRQIRPGPRTDAFHGGPVISLSPNASDNEVGAPYEPRYKADSQGAGWLYTEWSSCVGWCVGGGIQSRGTRCADPAGCAVRQAMRSSQTCRPKITCNAHEGQWFTGEWSKCSAGCGGQQIRGVLCIGGTGRRLRDTACKSPKPDITRPCGEACAPTWYLSEWGECKGPCEAGVQTRTVWCARDGAEGATGALRDNECREQRPLARRTCVPKRCSTKPAVQFAPAGAEPQPRVTRHEMHKPQDVPLSERSFTDGTKVCEDKLNNCHLAVQARLCHYHYYTEYCCRSCHGR
ncbi:unnamed protein product [Plutella xylostella]|uniref:(diamondback moth) hypothetical protein n=1 Tax=Plutella xylostella TaxID=51655 RepID=A0A8S4FAE9_PLUXY|nr:unnamed protein product [Plutella xylostella]